MKNPRLRFWSPSSRSHVVPTSVKLVLDSGGTLCASHLGTPLRIEMGTGVFDHEGVEIFEGDTLIVTSRYIDPSREGTYITHEEVFYLDGHGWRLRWGPQPTDHEPFGMPTRVSMKVVPR